MCASTARTRRGRSQFPRAGKYDINCRRGARDEARPRVLANSLLTRKPTAFAPRRGSSLLETARRARSLIEARDAKGNSGNEGPFRRRCARATGKARLRIVKTNPL